MARQKRIFREWQHPRDGRGRFARHGSPEWVKAAAEKFRAADTALTEGTRGPGLPNRAPGGRAQIGRGAKAGALFAAHDASRDTRLSPVQHGPARPPEAPKRRPSTFELGSRSKSASGPEAAPLRKLGAPGSGPAKNRQATVAERITGGDIVKVQGSGQELRVVRAREHPNFGPGFDLQTGATSSDTTFFPAGAVRKARAETLDDVRAQRAVPTPLRTLTPSQVSDLREEYMDLKDRIGQQEGVGGMSSKLRDRAGELERIAADNGVSLTPPRMFGRKQPKVDAPRDSGQAGGMSTTTPATGIDRVMRARSDKERAAAFKELTSEQIVEAFERNPAKALRAYVAKNFGKGSGREREAWIFENAQAGLDSGQMTPERAGNLIGEHARLTRGMQYHPHQQLAADLLTGRTRERLNAKGGTVTPRKVPTAPEGGQALPGLGAGTVAAPLDRATRTGLSSRMLAKADRMAAERRSADNLGLADEPKQIDVIRDVAAKVKVAKAEGTTGATAYDNMDRGTLLALARQAKVPVRGKSNDQIAAALRAKDEQLKAAKAAELNPSGIGTPSSQHEQHTMLPGSDLHDRYVAHYSARSDGELQRSAEIEGVSAVGKDRDALIRALAAKRIEEDRRIEGRNAVYNSVLSSGGTITTSSVTGLGSGERTEITGAWKGGGAAKAVPAKAEPAEPQPTYRVRRSPYAGGGGLIRHELVRIDPDGTETHLGSSEKEGDLIKRRRALEAELGPMIPSAKLEKEEAKLRARLDAYRAKRAGNTRKRATFAEEQVIERLQNLAPQLARSRREERQAAEEANPRGLGGVTISPEVRAQLVKDNLANPERADRLDRDAAEAVANGSVPEGVVRAAQKVAGDIDRDSAAMAQYRRLLGLPTPDRDTDQVMEVDASEIRFGDIVSVRGFGMQVATITGTGDARRVSGFGSTADYETFVGRVKVRRPGGARPKADAAQVAAADVNTVRAASLDKARTGRVPDATSSRAVAIKATLAALPVGFEPDDQTRQMYVTESRGTWHVGQGQPYYLQDFGTKREALDWIVNAQKSRERIRNTPARSADTTPYGKYGSLTRADFAALPPARQREIAAELHHAQAEARRTDGRDGGASLLLGAFGLALTPAERQAAKVDTPRDKPQTGGVSNAPTTEATMSNTPGTLKVSDRIIIGNSHGTVLSKPVSVTKSDGTAAYSVRVRRSDGREGSITVDADKELTVERAGSRLADQQTAGHVDRPATPVARPTGGKPKSKLTPIQDASLRHLIEQGWKGNGSEDYAAQRASSEKYGAPVHTSGDTMSKLEAKGLVEFATPAGERFPRYVPTAAGRQHVADTSPAGPHVEKKVQLTGTVASVGSRPRTGTWAGEIKADRKERLSDKAFTDHVKMLTLVAETSDQVKAWGFGDSDRPLQVGDEVVTHTFNRFRRGIVTGVTRDGKGNARIAYATPSGGHAQETTVPHAEVWQLVDPAKRPREGRTAATAPTAGPARLRDLPVGTTDAQAAKAMPRLDGESDLAYQVRTVTAEDTARRVLDGYSAGGLRAIARDNNVTVRSGATKPQLVEALLDALRRRWRDSRAFDPR